MKKYLYLMMGILLLNISKAQTTEVLESDKIVGVWEVGSGGGKRRDRTDESPEMCTRKITLLIPPVLPNKLHDRSFMLLT